jgi:hypothetical protein
MKLLKNNLAALQPLVNINHSRPAYNVQYDVNLSKGLFIFCFLKNITA